MRLMLIRHGQSQNNAKDQQRYADPDLTPLGWQQAEHLAAYLASIPEGQHIRELYSSPMRRALQTTQPIAEALGLRPELWMDVYEGGGLYLRDAGSGTSTGEPGMNRSSLAEQFPAYVAPVELGEAGWYPAEQGEEELEMLFLRAIRVAVRLRKRAETSHDNDVLAIVSHGGFIDALIKALFNQLPANPMRLHYTHRNTGVTRVIFKRDTSIALAYMNNTEHLPLEMRTW